MVRGAIKNKVIVGHSLWHILRRMFLSSCFCLVSHSFYFFSSVLHQSCSGFGIQHPKVNTRDLALYTPFCTHLTYHDVQDVHHLMWLYEAYTPRVRVDKVSSQNLLLVVLYLLIFNNAPWLHSQTQLGLLWHSMHIQASYL